MKIVGACLFVEKGDSCKGLTLDQCRIFCNFAIETENYKKPQMFEFAGVMDGKTQDFINVFDGVNMTSCVIEGTDMSLTEDYGDLSKPE